MLAWNLLMMLTFANMLTFVADQVNNTHLTGFMCGSGVSILMSYGENPHYVKLPIFSEFMENSTKFMKNSDLTQWTQNLR